MAAWSSLLARAVLLQRAVRAVRPPCAPLGSRPGSGWTWSPVRPGLSTGARRRGTGRCRPAGGGRRRRRGGRRRCRSRARRSSGRGRRRSSVPGQLSSRSSSAVSVSTSRSLVGSSRQQDVRLAHQQAHELQAAALAAAEVLHQACAASRRGSRSGRSSGAGGQLAAVAELLRRRAPRSTRLEHAQRARRSRRCPGTGARGCTVVPCSTTPEVGSSSPASSFIKRRLAGAVDADQRDAVARAEVARSHVAQQRLGPEGQRHVLGARCTLPPSRADANLEQLGGVARLGLVGDQRVGGLDPELRLGGPRRRPAAQPRQLLAHAAGRASPRARRPGASRSARAST